MQQFINPEANEKQRIEAITNAIASFEDINVKLIIADYRQKLNDDEAYNDWLSSIDVLTLIPSEALAADKELSDQVLNAEFTDDFEYDGTTYFVHTVVPNDSGSGSLIIEVSPV